MKLLSGIVLRNVLRYVFVQLFCLALFYLQNCAHTHMACFPVAGVS